MLNKTNLFIVGGIIIFMAVFLGFAYFASSNSADQEAAAVKTFSKTDESLPEISVGEEKFDFGTIKKADGEVSHDFVIKNNGAETLQVYGFLTSCMCTSAYVKKDGQRISKKFGMHKFGDWVGEVEPKEEIIVEVIFDPNFHKDTEGEIQRTLSFKTNDPKQEEVSLSISANVE